MENTTNPPPRMSPLSTNGKPSQSIMLKMVTVIGMGLLLLLPLHRVQKLVEERQQRKQDVIAEVSDSWAGHVSLAAPALVVPYQKGSNRDEMAYFTILPETLSIEGELTHQPRKRSLFEVILFQSDLEMDGEFLVPNIEELINEPKAKILWDQAFVTFTLSDQNSIQSTPTLQWGTEKLSFEPGLNRLVGSNMELSQPSGATRSIGYFDKNTQQAQGFDAALPTSIYPGQKVTYALDLSVKGSGSLAFIPMGKETKVALSSSWPSPSFAGEYIPTQHRASDTDSGFTAEWSVSYLNRGFPQYAKDFAMEHTLESTLFGVRLIEPVDSYVQTSRSVKYGILIIVLTFIGFFLMEVISKRRIHPFQYALVGVALVVFYTLLVSISEQIAFGWAYLFSAVATIGLITFYVSAILKSAKLTLAQAFGMAVTYSFIFVILRLEDYSLLAGSVGLFLLVGLLMALTRRINWYNDKPIGLN